MKSFVFEDRYTKEQTIIKMEDSYEFIGEEDVAVTRDNKVWFQLFLLPCGSKRQAKVGTMLYDDFVAAGYTFAAERYYLDN